MHIVPGQPYSGFKCGHVYCSGISSETLQPIALVVHQPAAGKRVGDLVSYVGATASAAWSAHLVAAAARELDAVSSCWSKRL